MTEGSGSVRILIFVPSRIFARPGDSDILLLSLQAEPARVMVRAGHNPHMGIAEACQPILFFEVLIVCLFRGPRKRPIKRPPKKGGRGALFRGIWGRPFLGSGPAGRFQDRRFCIIQGTTTTGTTCTPPHTICIRCSRLIYDL